MKADRWKQVRATFEDLLEVPPDGREERLDAACAGDPELRDEVQRLLKSHSELSGFLSHPDPPQPPSDLSGDVPRTVGDFEIRRVVASGGMGTVYEAVQHHPHRTVAIKVMRELIFDESARRRFQYESEILARLRHPGIAQVFASGTYGEGEGPASKPYIVLEYVVAALDLIAYCNQAGLEVKDRLRIFLQVCDAVHYSHQKGVIHRDLKPSNIIVDSSGNPKLIDFGVARTVAQDEELSFRMTQTGEIIGTLYYMSPEQISGAVGDIDTRSDVYSLGVVLFELLTGRLPFDFSETNLTQAMRIITDVRPSAPRALVRSLSKDLDWIALRALSKERNERYGSASELAADIRRHLADQPVVAGPPGAIYLLRKLVRRHPLPVSLAAVLLVCLIGFGFVMTIQAARIARERDRASQEAETANRVADFLTQLFGSANPWSGVDRSLSLRDLVDQGAARANEQLGDGGLVRARLLAVLGNVYSSLGEYEKAGALLVEGIEIAREHEDEGVEWLAEALRALAWTYNYRLRPAEAIPLCQEALELDLRNHGIEHANVASSLNHLATMQREFGLFTESKRNFERALAMREKLLGTDHQDLAFTLYHYACLLRLVGDLEQSRAAFERAATIFESTLGREHLAYAWCQSDLSKTLSLLGEVEAAFEAASLALAIRERLLPEGHPDFADAYLNLASLHWKRREFPQAREMYELALGIRIESLGRSHPETIGTLARLGVACQATGSYGEAESYLQQAIDLTVDSGGVRDLQFAENLQQLGNLQVRRGENELATETMRRALQAAEALPQPALSRETSIRFALASLLTDESDWLEASDHYEKVLAERIAHPEWTYPTLNRARFRCAEIRLLLDRVEAAEALLVLVERELSAIGNYVGPDLYGALWMLGQCDLLRGRDEQAAVYFERSLEASRARHGPEARGHLFLEAQRAAVLGDEALAARLLEQSIKVGLDLGRAVEILKTDAMRDWPVMRRLRERLEQLAQQSSD